MCEHFPKVVAAAGALPDRRYLTNILIWRKLACLTKRSPRRAVAAAACRCQSLGCPRQPRSNWRGSVRSAHHLSLHLNQSKESRTASPDPVNLKGLFRKEKFKKREKLNKQGKKVCKTTAVQWYQLRFSLRLLLFFARRVKWLIYNSYSGQLLTAAGTAVKRNLNKHFYAMLRKSIFNGALLFCQIATVVNARNRC